jgi:hypothetical protein
MALPSNFLHRSSSSRVSTNKQQEPGNFSAAADRIGELGFLVISLSGAETRVLILELDSGQPMDPNEKPPMDRKVKRFRGSKARNRKIDQESGTRIKLTFETEVD